MRNLIAVGILCGLSFLAVSEAAAQTQTLNVTARAGTTTTVASLPSWNARCGFDGYPDVTIDQEPSHGRLQIIRSSSLRVPSNAGRCAGRRVGGVIVRYASSRGFEGTDRARFTIREPDRGSERQNCRYSELPNGVIITNCDRVIAGVNVFITVR